MTFEYSVPRSKKSLPSRREEHVHPLFSMQQEMNKLFETFFQSNEPVPSSLSIAPASLMSRAWDPLSPRSDLCESDDEYIVTMELPGINETDIDVSMKNNILTVSGEKRQENQGNEKGWYRVERHFGSFSRSLPLPSPVQDDSASASFKNGVLTIRLPKVEKPADLTKRISVRQG